MTTIALVKSRREKDMTTLNPKVADRVTVSFEGEVLRTDPYDGCLVSLNGGKTGWMHPSFITAIHPRPLKVGDRVMIMKRKKKYPFGTIMGIDGSNAWVKLADDYLLTYYLSDLEPSND